MKRTALIAMLASSLAMSCVSKTVASDPSGTDVGTSWRWRYAGASGGMSTLNFYFDTGELGFEMKLATRQTATFLSDLRDGFATATLTKAASTLPDVVPARIAYLAGGSLSDA